MSSQQLAKRPKFSVAIQTEGYKKLINNTLQDPKRAQRFIASVSSAVATNPALQECDAGTILSCALLGESLELSPSPQLGQYYMVPFQDRKAGRTVATFILGYKGYIQLAVRSGQYKHLNVISIKDGEFVKWDPLTEQIELNLIQDETERETVPTIGYCASFEYINGFRKVIYWSREKMEAHALRYSAAFGPAPARGKFPGRASYSDYVAENYNKDDEWAYSSFWYKDFDGMAYKTMLRQIISKWGVMSIEMRSGVEGDGMVITESGTPDYLTSDDASAVPVADMDTAQDQTSDEAPDDQQPLSMNDI